MSLKRSLAEWVTVLFHLLFILIVSLWFIPVAFSQTIYSRSGQVSITWDDEQTDIEYYQIVLIRDRTGEEFHYSSTTKQITIKRPKSGVYVVKVRGCRLDRCSDWHTSLDQNAKLIDGSPGQWKVRFRPWSPGSLLIVD